MIELIKFELEKIFRNKGIYIAAVVIFTLVVGTSIVRYIEFKDRIGTRGEVQEIAESYMSESYSKNDIEEMRNKIIEKIHKNEELSRDETFLNAYLTSIRKKEGNVVEDNLNKINEELYEVEQEKNNESFEYKSLANKKEMLEAIPERESIYIGDWSKILNFKLSDLIRILLLTIGIAGIFSS